MKVKSSAEVDFSNAIGGTKKVTLATHVFGETKLYPSSCSRFSSSIKLPLTCMVEEGKGGRQSIGGSDHSR